MMQKPPASSWGRNETWPETAWVDGADMGCLFVFNDRMERNSQLHLEPVEEQCRKETPRIHKAVSFHLVDIYYRRTFGKCGISCQMWEKICSKYLKKMKLNSNLIQSD